jgi:hypothetical protein
LFTAAALLVFVIPAAAQGPVTDEQRIRALIARADQGMQPPRTADRIFWSAAFKRPVVGNQSAEEIPTDRRPALRVPGSQRAKTTVERIEIAKSGDLAYEFSNSDLSFQLKNGRDVSLPTSLLRVWRKEQGQWKVAANFSMTHYQEPATTASRPGAD